MADDDIVRKTVRPTDVGASIPDPSHPGLDIAQNGSEVVWDHYWIGRHARGEIVVMTDEEIAKVAADKKAAADAAAAEKKAAADKDANGKAGPVAQPDVASPAKAAVAAAASPSK